MSTDFSIYQMVADAGVVVQIVLAILLLASIACWAIIFRKIGELKRAEGGSSAFESDFWSGSDLSDLYRKVEGQKRDAAPLARIFGAGFREFARLVRHGQPGTIALGSARRAMDATGSRELDTLERSMGFLATVGSTAPYVGLFGTVWGIMSAFQGLGQAQQATLQMVAPGISEALIATAMGLFAAIPATVAYNRFSQRVDRLNGHFENFSDEFSNVLEHHQASEGSQKA